MQKIQGWIALMTGRKPIAWLSAVFMFQMKRVGWMMVLLGAAGTCLSHRGWAQVSVLADRVQQTYEAAADLQIEFIQKTYVAALEREISKEGSALFKKPKKFLIRYAGGQGRHYLSDGKTLWVYQSGDSTEQAYPLDEESIPAEALSFLGGLGNLKRDFAVEEVDAAKWAALKREKGPWQWIELTPLQKRSGLKWLLMGFDPQTALAREVYLANDSGNLSHYELKKVQLNPGVDDAVFELKKPRR